VGDDRVGGCDAAGRRELEDPRGGVHARPDQRHRAPEARADHADHDRADVERDARQRQQREAPPPRHELVAQPECRGHGLAGALEVEQRAVALEVVHVAAVVGADVDHDLHERLHHLEHFLGRALEDEARRADHVDEEHRHLARSGARAPEKLWPVCAARRRFARGRGVRRRASCPGGLAPREPPCASGSGSGCAGRPAASHASRPPRSTATSVYPA
jgi:hypothetical protein